MKIRQECIGNFHKAKSNNGVIFNVTIEDNPSKFEFYKLLKLDVFEKFESKAKVVEVVVEKKGKKNGGDTTSEIN